MTRPRAQAEAWVQGLQRHGVAAAALPLIEIAAVSDPAPLHAAWADIGGFAMLHFVSANAVAAFGAARPPSVDAAWPAGTLAGSTGPGTSAALRALGVPDRAIAEPDLQSGNFDAEALWLRLQGRDWAGQRVLVVRGEDGRDWLADRLGERGAQVGFLAAYRRTLPRLNADEQARFSLARARPRQSAWLFSSSQAVRHLAVMAAGADWSATAALATHERIAAAARAAGFGTVALTRPLVDEVAAVWRLLQSGAP